MSPAGFSPFLLCAAVSVRCSEEEGSPVFAPHAASQVSVFKDTFGKCNHLVTMASPA